MRYLLSIAIIILLAFNACQNKFLPKLYHVESGSEQLLELENCYFLNGYRLAEKPLSSMVQPGNGLVLITNQSRIDSGMVNVKSGWVTVDAQIRYQIAVQLPENLKKDSLDIAGNSTCLLVGKYDLPDSLKLYYCRQGYILIDSVKSSRFTAVLDGTYISITRDTLRFKGALKARRRD